MEFTNRISHSLFSVKGAGALKLRWIPVCALLAASAASLAQFNQPRPRLAQAEQATAPQGEAAVQLLKTEGGYASLAEALAAARYQINTAFREVTKCRVPGLAQHTSISLRPISQISVDKASGSFRPSGRQRGTEITYEWLS